jgi:hypothetical protein
MKEGGGESTGYFEDTRNSHSQSDCGQDQCMYLVMYLSPGIIVAKSRAFRRDYETEQDWQ